MFIQGSKSKKYLQICDKVTEEDEGSWKGKMMFIQKSIDRLYKKINSSNEQAKINANSAMISSFDSKFNVLEEKINLNTQQLEKKIIHLLENISSIRESQEKSFSFADPEGSKQLTREEVAKLLEERPATSNLEIDELIRNRTIEFARDNMHETMRNTLQGFQEGINDKNEKIMNQNVEIHERINMVEGSLRNTIDTKFDHIGGNIENQMEDVKGNFRKEIVLIEGKLKDSTRNMTEILDKNTQKIVDSIMSKLENKFSSMEGMLKTKIDQRVEIVENNLTSKLENGISSINHDIRENLADSFEAFDNKLKKIMQKINETIPKGNE